MFELLQRIEANKDGILAGIKRLKAILLAKIVNDKLRYEKAVRQTGARFQFLRGRTPPCGLTPGEAETAERFLMEFEEQLDLICPIRTFLSPGKSPEAPPRAFTSAHGPAAMGKPHRAKPAATAPVPRKHPE
jgi:hypothetical protein